MKFENTEVWGFKHALRVMRNPKNSWDKSDSKFSLYRVDKGDVLPKELLKAYPNAYITEQHYDCLGRLCSYVPIIIGEKDMKLAQSLIRAGGEHRKFLRQIFVSVDITAPLYWWKEFDTYKIGTVANSTSTMHKIASKPITLDCFEIDDYDPDLLWYINCDCRPAGEGEEYDVEIAYGVNDFMSMLEDLRQRHLTYIEKSKSKDITDAERKHFQRIAKKYWKELIRWLPESWLQTRTVTMDYENLFAMCSKGQRRFHKLNEWSGIDDNTLENFIKWARTLPYAQEFIFIDELEEKRDE